MARISEYYRYAVAYRAYFNACAFCNAYGARCRSWCWQACIFHAKHLCRDAQVPGCAALARDYTLLQLQRLGCL